MGVGLETSMGLTEKNRIDQMSSSKNMSVLYLPTSSPPLLLYNFYREEGPILLRKVRKMSCPVISKGVNTKFK